MQITRTVGIETAAAKSPWDQFWEWFLSLQQWQQALIVATPLVGIMAYAAIKK